MNIERILATLSSKDAKALGQFLKNANDALHRSPDDPEALRLRDAVTAELDRRRPSVTDGWTRGTHGDPRHLMRAGEIVASVYRLETHRSDNDGVWSVVVLGRELPETYRHIDDARRAAENELARLT
ncbi:MAG: hypothetical protein KDK53_06225 [Maritimibacter sp.]|nr:hypothetical protein [Maritimibacter sp.]